MIHIFRKGLTDQTLLLLHGTGGDEYDLLDIGRQIDKDANILSVRGSVNENGMNRFFRRLAMGVFDQQDLEFRTFELYDFIIEASQKYKFPLDKLTVVGYSNGANIAGSILFHIKDSIKNVIMLHPMVPIRGLILPDMSNVKVFIGAGTNDQICPKEETYELSNYLIEAKANVFVSWYNYGHRLSKEEIQETTSWYKKYIVN